MENIKTRRSIRKYKDIDIEKEKLDSIIEAAMLAPSARNQQPWEFLVVTNKEKLIGYTKLSPNAKMLETAFCAIIFLIDTRNLKTPMMAPSDMAAAVENSLLEARSLGIGSCWCGIYPNEERMKTVSEYFNIKEYAMPFALVAYGYPDNDDSFCEVNRYDKNKVHYEEF